MQHRENWILFDGVKSSVEALPRKVATDVRRAFSHGGTSQTVELLFLIPLANDYQEQWRVVAITRNPCSVTNRPCRDRPRYLHHRRLSFTQKIPWYGQCVYENKNRLRLNSTFLEMECIYQHINDKSIFNQ